MEPSSCLLHTGRRRAVIGRGTLLIALALVAVLAGEDGRRPGAPEPLLLEQTWQHTIVPARITVAPGDEPEKPEPPETPETIDELRERIAEVLDRHEVPGVGLALIQRGGEIWSGGVGLARRESSGEPATPIGADTMFRVGSITKTVVALAILRLVEEGRLDLDTPVRDIAPEIDMSNAWDDTAPITVAHLLEHTAGFDDARFNEMYVPGQGDAELSVTDALAQNPRSRASRWQPGRYHAYSNPGYSVAAYVIEKITGEPFDRHVEREVLRPLGMWHTSFSRTPAVQRHLAQGHAGRRQQPVPYRRIYHRAAGDLKASPRELARLVKLLIDRGQTRGGAWLREGSIARMEAARTRVQPLPGMSYGLGNGGDPSLPVPTRGHGGGIAGFVSDYRYAPSLGVGYMLLFNSSSEAVLPAYVEIRTLVFDYLTRGMELPAPPGPPSTGVPAHELARLAGYYELASPRHALTGFIERALLDAEVRLAGDTLHLRLGSLGSTPLIPVGGDRFRVPGHSAAAIAFATAGDGSRTLFVMDASFEPGTAWLGNLRRRALTLAYSLMQIGSFWNFLWLPAWLFVMARTRQRLPLPPGSAPALAALSFFAMLALVSIGLDNGDLGHVTALSLGCLALGLVFPVTSAWALAKSIIELRRGSVVSEEIDELASLAAFGISIYDRGLRGRIYDLAVALACLVVSLYLAYHGVIGLRTWAW
ncbi:MAG TPA: serine hydrolase domain-containing protein [Haliangium sp.]|nr:serine hydrolase domain-containing protein [Haliangium sp.]